MMNSIVRSCGRLQRPFYSSFLNHTVCYRTFNSSQFKASHHQVPNGNVWSLQWWNKFWRTWAPVPTLFGLTIFIVWQYSRRLQHRFVNDQCSTASQLEIQCYRSIPLRFLSRSWGKLSHIEIPTPLRRLVYMTFSKSYGINLDEVKEDLDSYASLGEFFIRHLKPGVRPIALTDLVSPADGTVLNCGRVTSCCVEQIKGTTYLIRSFLGDNTWSANTTHGPQTHLAYTIAGETHLHITANKSTNTSAAISYLENKDILKQDYLNKLSHDLKTDHIRVYKCTNEDETEHNYAKVKSKGNDKFPVELPVVPNILDYYVKDLIYSVYSSVNLLLYRGNLAMPTGYYQMSSSPSHTPVFSAPTPTPDKPPICTPSAEEEWLEYKKHLLHNPRDNELYQLIVYLAPGDYHRFHSPAQTDIKFRRHFQGDLLSVNPCVACWIPDLFVLNERAAYMGQWKHGFFSMVMVGATNVGSIKVHCDETLLTNCRRWGKGVRHKDLTMGTKWEKGEEVGEFRMGSTVVLLFEAPKNFQFDVSSGDKRKVGQCLMRT
uniref:Phosphatidylserine decarboxylase proenzyme, mitochondrial n=1 Tax=Cacopsylla melanoneura TaxID=428564 RepID=A0A8D8XPR2_9HEMI